jgi:hypothetical protein
MTPQFGPGDGPTLAEIGLILGFIGLVVSVALGRRRLVR